MPDVPNVGQLVLLGTATVAFLIATVIAVMRLSEPRESLRIPGKIALYVGIAARHCRAYMAFHPS